MKLCDFGISGQLVDSIAKTRDAGCRPYMAVGGTNNKCCSCFACIDIYVAVGVGLSSILFHYFQLVFYYIFANIKEPWRHR